jgi:predicted phage terminase large subunit-like protein
VTRFFEDDIHAERERRRIEEEAEEMGKCLGKFVRGAWPILNPKREYHHNWHIDAIAEHLEAITEGKILRLQVWVPPGSMKSLNVSVFWPAWEWIVNPGLRYWTASYEIGLAGRLASKTRTVLLSEWYRRRWSHFNMKKTDERYYDNDMGGSRLATAPGSTGIGEHGDRIIIDDAINAKDANATSRSVLDATNTWYDETCLGRLADPMTGAVVNIQQRLHEDDLAGHLIQVEPEEWTILCLPERYEEGHDYAWTGDHVVVGDGDPRSEGELLWPTHRDEKASSAFAKRLTSHKAAGQLQQRPTSREGEMFLRKWWQFFNPAYLAEDFHLLPKFSSVAISWDTSFKDKTTSDYVSGQAWGVVGANRYLLRSWHGRWNLTQTKTVMKEARVWARQKWPHAAHFSLVEKSANGVEIIEQMKAELTGLVPITVSHDKTTRAEAALPALEFGNVYVPGYARDDRSGPKANTPSETMDLIEECAKFPNGKNDDRVDAFTQAMNWISTRAPRPLKTSSAFRGRRRQAVPTGS